MNIKIKIFLSMVIVIAVSLIIALAAYILLNIFKSASEDETRYFNIAIGHINDFRARFEESCKDDKCIGGFARLVTIYKQTKNETNYILLNAGNNFHGTLFYNIFKWNITAYFMNMLSFDAIALGNHDFNDNVTGVVPFIKNLKAPVVISNIDDTEEPTMQGTYKKSIVITRDNQRIGIIGITTSKTKILSNPGKIKFLNEIEAVNKEAKRLLEEEKVFTNIVISHCGFTENQNIAMHSKYKISVIVGGHSHILLYSGNTPSGDKNDGPYPTVARNEDGFNVLIVQVTAYTKYFGLIKVAYNKSGLPIEWSGQPMFLNQSITPDTNILEKLQPWKKSVESISNEILGITTLNLTIDGCFTTECTMGNFVTDAMVEAWKEAEVSDVNIALIHPGGLQKSIPEGSIAYKDIINTLPFGNTFDCGEVQGKYLKEAFEFATKPFQRYKALNMLQVSGLEVTYVLTNPSGSKLTSLKVKRQNSPKPKFDHINTDVFYKIVVPSFLTHGGDGFVAISNNIRNLKRGPVDIDYFRKYIPKKTPFNTIIGGRIIFKGRENRKS